MSHYIPRDMLTIRFLGQVVLQGFESASAQILIILDFYCFDFDLEILLRFIFVLLFALGCPSRRLVGCLQACDDFLAAAIRFIASTPFLFDLLYAIVINGGVEWTLDCLQRRARNSLSDS